MVFFPALAIALNEIEYPKSKNSKSENEEEREALHMYTIHIQYSKSPYYGIRSYRHSEPQSHIWPVQLLALTLLHVSLFYFDFQCSFFADQKSNICPIRLHYIFFTICVIDSL